MLPELQICKFNFQTLNDCGSPESTPLGVLLRAKRTHKGVRVPQKTPPTSASAAQCSNQIYSMTMWSSIMSIVLCRHI